MTLREKAEQRLQVEEENRKIDAIVKLMRKRKELVDRVASAQEHISRIDSQINDVESGKLIEGEFGYYD